MAVFHMGTAGAAIATVLAQAASVIISLKILSRKALPFHFERSDIRFEKTVIRKVTWLGLPIALQDLLNLFPGSAGDRQRTRTHSLCRNRCC